MVGIACRYSSYILKSKLHRNIRYFGFCNSVREENNPERNYFPQHLHLQTIPVAFQFWSLFEFLSLEIWLNYLRIVLFSPKNSLNCVWRAHTLKKFTRCSFHPIKSLKRRPRICSFESLFLITYAFANFFSIKWHQLRDFRRFRKDCLIFFGFPNLLILQCSLRICRCR